MTSERGDIEFKSSFDLGSAAEWVELVKDFVAIANSGGGMLCIGLNSDGTPSSFDAAQIFTLDPADIIDKIFKYTGQQFDGFDIIATDKEGHSILAIVISPAPLPLIFVKPGTYDAGAGKQKTAFSSGTVYFRHGAKSEPGSTDDLRLFIEARLEEVRKSWLEGISKVVEAPSGSQVKIVPPGTSDTVTQVHLVNDPAAPAHYQVSVDATHPFRQKEVVEEFNKRAKGASIKPFHIQCVRQAHDIDDNPNFCYRQKFASARYSYAFVEWIVERYTADPEFFVKAKVRADERRRHPDTSSI